MYVLNDYSIAWDVDAARPHGLVQRLLVATPRPRDLQDDALGGITDLVAVDPLVNLESKPHTWPEPDLSSRQGLGCLA